MLDCCMLKICRRWSLVIAWEIAARGGRGKEWRRQECAIPMDEKFNAEETFHRRFKEVECMLDHNRLLISEINHNHETRIPERLTRNVTLIRELNHNILKVVGMYSDLSAVFEKSFENVGDGAAEGDWMCGDEGCVPQSDSRDSSESDGAKRMRIN